MPQYLYESVRINTLSTVCLVHQGSKWQNNSSIYDTNQDIRRQQFSSHHQHWEGHQICCWSLLLYWFSLLCWKPLWLVLLCLKKRCHLQRTEKGTSDLLMATLKQKNYYVCLWGSLPMSSSNIDLGSPFVLDFCFGLTVSVRSANMSMLSSNKFASVAFLCFFWTLGTVVTSSCRHRKPHGKNRKLCEHCNDYSIKISPYTWKMSSFE